MTFNQFRFVVTILASLSGFMAYQGRFNLSLVIEEMVYKDLERTGPSTGPGSLASDLASELEELERSLPRLNNEEQTLAQLSLARGRSSGRRMRFPLDATSTLVARNMTRSIYNELANSKPLAIDVDVNANGGRQPAAGSGASIISTQSPALEQPEKKLQQNLLRWNERQKNDLQGAFFFGYVLFMIPAGRAAEIFGPKTMFLCLGLGTGLTSLVFPYAASLSEGSIVYAYMVRFLMGMSQAGLFPAAYVLLCKWLPKDERSKWLPVTGTSSRIGMILMNFVAPLILCTYGWEMVFYASGLVTLLYGLLFFLLGSDTPATSRWISQRERLYIESRIETRASSAPKSLAKLPAGMAASSLPSSQETAAATGEKVPPINWLKLATNRPMMMLALVMFTAEWGSMLLFVKLPGFLGLALKMDLKEIGNLGIILNLIFCFQFPLSGYIAARLENSQMESLTSLRVRKIFELIANGLQAAACLTLAFFNHKAIVIGALVVLMLGRSTVGGGSCIMPPELTRDYPGSLVALANSLANIAGIIGPIVVTWLVDEPTLYESWRNLWLLSAAIFATGGLLFCIFAQNKPQDFAKRRKHAKSTSQANLVFGSVGSLAPLPPLAAEEMIKMDAYSRVSSEPRGQKLKR